MCSFMCFGLLANAQGLGDYMEIDGVPGFIFYLDETGEHGLVMSFPAISEKQLKKTEGKAMKLAKKRGLSEDEIKKNIQKLAIKESAKGFKDRKEYYPELIKYLSGDGEQNTIAIADFCKEKGLNEQEFFPACYWASQLGMGWFVPGENELNKFAEFYLGGTGKGFKVKLGNFYKNSKSLSNDIQVQEQLTSIAYNGILSSSIKDCERGFLGLIHYHNTNALNGGEWFELTDNVVAGKVLMGTVAIKNPAENAVKTQAIAIHKF